MQVLRANSPSRDFQVQARSGTIRTTGYEPFGRRYREEWMAEPVCVEQATSAHLEAGLPLLERFFLEEGFATSRGQIRDELLALLTNDDCAVFLAWLDQTAVGVATVTTSRGIELGLSAELEDLYVLPKTRRKGVGRELIDAAKRWCHDRGCRSISVVITPEGQSAHNLVGYYRAQGFEETGRTILLTHL